VFDWGARLVEEKVNPTNSVYREWIDLHGPEVLGDLVSWLENHINNDSKITLVRTEHRVSFLSLA
jgi:thiaminase